MRLLDGIINKALFHFFNLFEPKSKSIPPNTPQLVAKRFRQLFVDHGVEETRIPRFFSKITLEDLQSDSLLIKKLTPELINEVAQLFNVRSEWLEGVDNTIYLSQTCYKEPEDFFTFLKTIKYGKSDFPFRVISSVEKFDYKDDSRQPFSIVYVEKIAELGDDNIYRYYLDAGWTWSHRECRMQLKAMALLYWRDVKRPITFYKVPHDIYLQIEELQLIPYPYLKGPLVSDPSVEDYISDPQFSGVAKEYDELPAVLEYIQVNNLSELTIPKSTIDLSKTIEKAGTKQAKVIKGGRAKNQLLSEIKELFLIQYSDRILKDEISSRQAAFEFYDSLNENQEIILSRSSRDYEKASPDERRMNAMRTLTAHISKYKKKN
jgi:hypothetical protein